MVGSDRGIGSYGVDSEDPVHSIPLEIDMSTEPQWGTEKKNPSPKEEMLQLSVTGFPASFYSPYQGICVSI